MDPNASAPAEPTPHRQAWDLIPWLVGGSASEAEARLVQQHAAGCADCREELAFHQAVHISMQTDMQAGMAAPHSPEPALAALWARINQAQASPPEVVAGTLATTPATSLAATLAGTPSISLPTAFTSGPTAPLAIPSFRSEPRWTRWLVAAVLVQAVGLATLAGLLLERQRDAAYQTFSSPAPATATVRLVPAASLPVGQLQTLLADNGLLIVASSPDGRVLSLARLPAHAQTAVPVAALLARLRALPGVVLAEPVQPPPLP